VRDGRMIRTAAYLAAAGIPVAPGAREAVGRLALTGAFNLAGQRGIVVKPKQGSISEKYLDVLGKDESLRLVAVDGAHGIEIFGRRAPDDKLRRIPALPFSETANFIGREVLAEVLRRIQRNNSSLASDVNVRAASLLLAAKIADERSGGLVFSSLDTYEIPRKDSCRAFASRATRLLPEGLRKEAARTLTRDSVCESACLLAPFRITPKMESELATILEAVGEASAGGVALPGVLFRGVAEIARELVKVRKPRALAVIGQTIDTFISAAANAQRAAVYLPRVDSALAHLLTELLPGVSVRGSHTIDPFADTDLLLVVLPFRSRVIDRDRPLKNEVGRPKIDAPRSQAIEVLALEEAIRMAPPGAWIAALVPESMLANAGHAETRRWLLERVRVLAVIGFERPVFSRSPLRASLLLVENKRPVQDYDIFMCELGEQDFQETSLLERLRAALAEFVEANNTERKSG
jgi:hypothetical protein